MHFSIFINEYFTHLWLIQLLILKLHYY